jgi:chromosomal replication initiator protein
MAMEGGTLQVQTSSSAHHTYLDQQCRETFNKAAQQITGRLITLQFLPPTQQDSEPPLSFEAETKALQLNPDYTFSNFVTGTCNRLAQAACVAVAESPGHVYNPLFVHGSVGLGKSHLLQAVCHRLNNNGYADKRILYLSCETFTNHFVEAIERGALHQFRYRYRYVDVLVIDDIQFLCDREQSREEFFHTFNTLYQAKKQIILSADEAPNGIPRLEERLISRFNWGLVVRIDPPSLETRMAILRKKAAIRCAEIPEDVLYHIAATVQSNTRELEGALSKVLAFSQQFGGTINLDMTRQALSDFVPEGFRQIGISDIVEVIMEWFHVRLGDLQGKRRNRSIALPRQVCMYLARQLTSLSLEEIGGFFGGRDHTTVLHAVRTVTEQSKVDPDLQNALAGLTTRLHQKVA